MEQKNFSTFLNEVIDDDVLFTGIQINYFVHCKTQLWYFSHFITREYESELVILGKILHETVFRNVRKDILIDQKISIDFIKKGNKLVIHDIKKSDKFKEAHYYQMLYYLYYLKHKKGIKNVEGIINYPLKKKILKVILTEEKEREIERMLSEIDKIIKLPLPPSRMEKKQYCKNCSYFELCWI